VAGKSATVPTGGAAADPAATLPDVSIQTSTRPPAWLDLPERFGDEVRISLRIGEDTRFATYASRDVALEPNPDAGFAAALPIAMATASSLAVRDGVSRQLLDGAERIQQMLAAWDPALLPVELRCGGGANRVAETSPRGTAVFFTGGVDSFYTLLTRREQIDALVHVHGFDLPLGEERKRALVSASLRTVAGELGLPLIEIETDLRTISDDVCGWELVYTSAALASVGHLLAPRFERILIPATHSLRDLHPIGTHPLLDPLYSSERLRFEHVDSVPRVDKLAYLAESELAMSSLRVCFQPQIDALNCGRCPKCVRTMVGLRVIGALGRCSTLPAEFSLLRMSKGKVRRRQSLTYVWENLDAVEARGSDPDLAFALTRLVARGARGEARAETRRLAEAARRATMARLPSLRRVLRAARRVVRSPRS
jgi:hypothetical protein